MRKEAKILLGFTNDNKIVFGRVGLYDDRRFSASFETSSPMVIKEDEILNNLKDYLEDMDVQWWYDKLTYFDCRPSELAEKILEDEEIEGVIDLLYDTSLYTKVYNIDGVDGKVHFESLSSGQHDTRGKMKIYTNKYLYDLIHNLWDKYHLKVIPEEKAQELFDLIGLKNDIFKEMEYVEKWLIELKKNNEL